MKLSKKLLVAALLLSSTFISNVFAEDANHEKLFPDFSNFEFDENNIYFGAEIPFSLPVGFTGEQKIAGIGSGFAVEAGYDLDGWLAGIHAEYRHNVNNDNLMLSLNNLFITAEVSKLFGSSLISFLPEYLDLRATAGIGLDVINTVYYPNKLYKIAGVSVKGKASALVYNFGAEVEYNALDKVIPYAGIDLEFAGDKSGMFVHSALNVGARTTLRRIRGPEDNGNPKVTVSTTPAFFTPDGDGKNDTLTFKIRTKYQKEAEPKSWKVEILEEVGNKTNTIKTYSGEGVPPTSLVWDGQSDNKNFAPTSAAEYKVLVTVEDSLGNVNVKETTANIGILVEKLEDGSLRILVNSIKFDPNKATFDTLSAKDKKSNETTIKMIADALKKYKQYNVIVEGHAHNVSGIEKEETEELIPLSKERADAIMKILVEEGVAESKLTAVGKGGKEPISSEPAKNRRVEFKLVSNNVFDALIK